MMGFSEVKLKPLILEALGGFTLSQREIGLEGWSKEHAAFLDFCLSQAMISEEELKKIVAARIKQLGRASYLEHINGGVPPDQTTSPHALSYAIRTEELSSVEVDQLKFEHGENRYTFFEEDWKMMPHDISYALQREPFD